MSQAPIGPSFNRGAKVGVDVRFSPNSGAKADMPAGPSRARRRDVTIQGEHFTRSDQNLCVGDTGLEPVTSAV